MVQILPIVTVGIAAFLTTGAMAQGPGYGSQMMGWNGWGGGSIVGPFFMILVLAAIVAVIVLFFRSFAGGQGAGSPYQGASGRQPLDILKERFARGEIGKEEYEERRRVLGN